VQYKISYDSTITRQTVSTINYGRLEKILVCQLGPEDLWKDQRSKIQILALIVPCKTEGEDAAVQTVYYRNMAASIITDVRNIQAVVGRASTRGKWGILDRKLGSINPIFAAVEGDDEGQESDSE
jgi:hypothetical protein